MQSETTSDAEIWRVDFYVQLPNLKPKALSITLSRNMLHESEIPVLYVYHSSRHQRRV